MTALPASSDFTGPVTEGAQKAFINDLRLFLVGLLGADGSVAIAQATLGTLASVYAAKTAAYTVMVADRGRIIDGTTGTWTLGLPAVAAAGAGFSLILRNSGAGVITIDPSGSEQIDGITTMPVSPGRAVILTCTGTAWVSHLMVAGSFTSTAAGLAPLSGGGTTNYLRADGSWVAPVVADGDKGDVVVSGGVWSLDYAAVNAVVAPVWGNITARPTTVATSGLTDAVSLTGAQVLTNKTVTDSSFLLQDDADNTKTLRFQLASLTTGTTRTLTVPDANGTIATLESSLTFNGASINFGGGTASYQASLGGGAALSGNTKTVNIGTSGAAGSTTSIIIGSGISGALGSLTINSPNVSFGANVSAISLPDAITFFVDNATPSKRMQFELSGLTAATTRVVSVPDADGTLVLDTAAQTLTNKALSGGTIDGAPIGATTPATVKGSILTSTSVITDGVNAHAAGTLALAFASRGVATVTPNATGTFTTTLPPAGTRCNLILTTSGTTSFTMTFGTGFVTTGPLTTGTVTAKKFVLAFISDGTALIEEGRTVAM